MCDEKQAPIFRPIKFSVGKWFRSAKEGKAATTTKKKKNKKAANKTKKKKILFAARDDDDAIPSKRGE